MAGDWIKIEHALPDKPEVIRIADELQIDQDAVAGKLIRLWIWADQNTVDGNAVPVTSSFLDRKAAFPGFAAAMRKVGWLVGREGSLTFPQFNRHNGQSAKLRAETNRRVAKSRAAKLSDTNGVAENCNANVTPTALQKPLPEKRREELVNTNDTHTSGVPGSTLNPRVPMPESVPAANAAIHGIEIEGDMVMYQGNEDRWSVAFVAWWNSLAPHVHPWPLDDLDDALKSELYQRLLEPKWFWKLAKGELPLETASDWKPGLPWFLEHGNLTKIIGKKYKTGTKRGDGNVSRARKGAGRSAQEIGPGQCFDPSSAATRGVNDF